MCWCQELTRYFCPWARVKLFSKNFCRVEITCPTLGWNFSLVLHLVVCTEGATNLYSFPFSGNFPSLLFIGIQRFPLFFCHWVLDTYLHQLPFPSPVAYQSNTAHIHSTKCHHFMECLATHLWRFLAPF